jgi:hypothetical protein
MAHLRDVICIATRKSASRSVLGGWLSEFPELLSFVYITFPCGGIVRPLRGFHNGWVDNNKVSQGQE